MVNFINLRLAIFLLAIVLLLISFLGSPNAPIYSIITGFDLYKILEYFTAHEDSFRPPDTPLRFILFSISIILLLLTTQPKINYIQDKSQSIKYIIFSCIAIFMFLF